MKEKDLQDDNECMDINIVRAQPAINKNNRKIIRSRWDRTVEKIDEDI